MKNQVLLPLKNEKKKKKKKKKERKKERNKTPAAVVISTFLWLKQLNDISDLHKLRPACVF